MPYSRPLIFLTAIFLAGLATSARADDAAKQTLAEKNLSLRGNMYVLPGDGEVAKEMATLLRANRDYEKFKREYSSDERKIRKAKSYIAQRQYLLERTVKDNQGKKFTQKDYNRLMSQINALKQEVEDLSKQKAAKEAQMRQQLEAAQAKYVEVLMTLTDKATSVRADYETLAADDAVTAAIEKITKDGGRPVVLGPSKPFIALVTRLEKLRDDIKAGVVQLKPENGILWVDVRVNGKSSRTMVLDTGASTVSLPWDFAQELGIQIGPDNPTVRVQLADGKIVDAKQVILESVQVGQFLVKQVEATVLPEDLIAAHPLLGGSFLNHFTYKIEPEKGRLLLTQNDGDAAGESN